MEFLQCLVDHAIKEKLPGSAAQVRTSLRKCLHLLHCFLLTHVVHLPCSDPDNFRLVGGTSRCNGGLELQHNNHWKTVDSLSWDHRMSKFVCHWLSCGSPTSIVRRPLATLPFTWWIDKSCVQSHALLRDCVTTDRPRNSNIEIHCSGKSHIDTFTFYSIWW